MSKTRIQQIKTLQKNTENIRNICIIAHVDHGKTTLSDCLLSSNGIISSKLAGKIRYLDSREDEQERGITMKSSGISLFFNLIQTTSDKSGVTVQQTKEYLINLIDSPGHVDFSSEVSTASRLCDGGLLLVDAVEGVCAQTHTVLRQAIQEKVKPILVLNKIDRLFIDLKKTPLEAYCHLTNILEQVNAIVGAFEAGDILESNDSEKFQDIYFSPERGNVIFASAIDGWAFRTSQFAHIYAKKLGVNEALLNKYLWGGFYLDPKTKKILAQKNLNGKNLKPLFVQFVLENIWAVYDTILIQKDKIKLEKMTASLGVKLAPRDLNSKDSRALLNAVMGQWLPLSQAVLLTVVQKIWNPIEAQAERMKSIIQSDDTNHREKIQEAILTCDSNDDKPVVAFLSKMFSVSESELPVEQKEKYTVEQLKELRREAILKSEMRKFSINEEAYSSQNSNKSAEVLIGFARIYSGRVDYLYRYN
jgi:ribosome assembly protein 1